MTAVGAVVTRDTRVVAVAAVLAAALGVGLVAVGSRLPGALGPVAVVALPLLPMLALAVLADPRLGVLAVVASFPVGVTDVPVVQLQLVQAVIVAVAVLVVLRRLAAGAAPLPWVRGAGWLVAFTGWLLIALPSAADRQRALREVVLFALGIVLALAMAAACRSRRDVRLVLGALVAIVAAVGATTPLGAADVQAAFGGAVVHGRATGIFVEPNQLGTFCTTGALVATGLCFAARTRRTRLLAGVAAALATLGLLLSLSRGSWIGFVLGVGVLLAKLPEARRALLALSVPLVVVALAVGAFAPTSPQVEVVGQRLQSITGEKNPYDDRPAIWADARSEIERDPLTGHGPGNFPVVSSRVTSSTRTTFAEHAHNLFLTWGAEAGLPAVAFAVGAGVHLHMRTRALGRREDLRRDRAVVAGVAAALIGVLGQGLVDYTLHNSVVATVLFILIGAVFAYERQSA